MGNKEILTLQFGHYSNYIGTHWWNIQERGFEYGSSSVTEINHDVLYREGLTEKNEVTFTPRLLLVDLKGSLNSLPETGNLYNSNLIASTVEWDPNLLEVKNEPARSKNKFQKNLEDPTGGHKVDNDSYDLEKDVSVWSDFLYTRFHPRSVNIITEYQHGNENTPFDIFPLGSSLWKSSQFDDDFCNKIRNYIEECDSFQGFHIVTDCTDAFSGLSSSCMQYLIDDYDRKPMLVFPVVPSHFPNKLNNEQQFVNDSIRVLNVALGFASFDAYSSLFVPLSTGSKGWRQPGPKREFNNIIYNHEFPYHSSAILASALETFTLKYRLKSSSFSMIDLCTDLNRNERKAAAASLCLPFSFNGHADLLECLDNWQGPLTQSITPSCVIGSQNLIQYMTLRGINEDKLKQPRHLAEKQCNLNAYKCGNITDMLNSYLAYSTEYSISNVTVAYKPLNLKTPYPQIFVKQTLDDAEESLKRINTENVPVLAGLHNGPDVGDMLESLRTETQRIKFAKFPQFTMGGMEHDEFHECLNTLYTLRENYKNKNYL